MHILYCTKTNYIFPAIGGSDITMLYLTTLLISIPKNSFAAYAFEYYFDRNSSYIITNKKFYDRSNTIGENANVN